MFPVKIAITGLAVIAVMAGCTKKKATKDKEFASSASSVTSPSASQDIFDEFYKEDSGANKPAESKPSKTEPVVRAPMQASFSENGKIVVQISTVRSRTLADEITSKLSAKGYPAYVAQVENPTPSLSGTYYRIRIGGFNTVSAARSFGENTLTAEGYEYWVDNRSNDNVGLQGGGMGGGDTYYSTQPSTTSEPTSAFQPSYSSQPEPATNLPAPKTVTNDEFQPSNKSQPSPANLPPPKPVAEPVPASSYTPESAAQEFEATPATPPPAPPTTPATPDDKSEWGNEGW